MAEPISTTAALILGGASVGSSLVNAIFQPGQSGMTWGDYEKSLGLSQAQWAENARMYDLQRANYRSDVEDERAYNSPAAQVERLRAAGLNPALAFGQGNFGTSSPTPPQAATPAAPAGLPTYDRASLQYQAVRDLAQTLGGSVAAFLDNQIRANEVRRTGALAEQESVKSAFAYSNAINDAEERLWRAKRGSLDYDVAKVNLDFLRSVQKDRISQMQYTTRNLEYQQTMNQTAVKEMNSRIQLNQLNAKLAPLHLRVEQQKAQAAFVSANAAVEQAAAAMLNAKTNEKLGESNVRLNNANIDKLAAEAANVWIRTASEGIDYSNKAKYRGIIENLYKTQLTNENTKEESRSGLIPLYLGKELMPTFAPIIGLGR